jgi:hypothetical protein
MKELNSKIFDGVLNANIKRRVLKLFISAWEWLCCLLESGLEVTAICRDVLAHGCLMRRLSSWNRMLTANSWAPMSTRFVIITKLGQVQSIT